MSMKGRPVTDAEKLLHDKVAQLGCVACRQEGVFNTHISIHHVHGRTKPGAHMHVLPLCAPHHVDDGTALAVHPHKRRWETKYGKQDDLVAAQWKELGVEHKAPERKAKPIVKKCDKPAKKVTPKAKIQSERKLSPAPAQQRIAQRAPAPTPSPGLTNTVKARAPKIKRPKPVKTAQQVAFLEERRADQKKIMDERKPAMKAQAKAFADARKAEYLEANKDQIAERKAKQKEDQKRFRDEMKKRMKKAG
ncbi:Ref family recombination enhancement nuclease [Pseudomonas sp. PLMAX]|jgi:hypothetical protein|uniref:Ref family recombination enhancement nuclease n=1 Tax=Pseudomonas sp. PLMAX TaxID=2201998 RepID=UPI0038BC0541